MASLASSGDALQSLSTSLSAAYLNVDLAGWIYPIAAAGLILYPVVLLIYTCCIASSSTEEGSSDKKPSHLSVREVVLALVACLVWPCICALPIIFLTGRAGSQLYQSVFPADWYDMMPVQHEYGPHGYADPRVVKPLGLILGILAVAVGQIFVILYHVFRRAQLLGQTVKVQSLQNNYYLSEAIVTHLSQPEGFALIGGYLVGTWMLGWMPASYYSFSGGINWIHVGLQLLLQDGFQWTMHYGEHKISSWVYRNSHKPHHRFTNPRLFDAFNGSLTDTLLMIVVPFILVARIVPANVWSYMTFGSLYANWLVLIHSEYEHPWDGVFRVLGFGTAGDHHVHHRLFVFNFGHLFMYWDHLLGTYRSPSACHAQFHKSAESAKEHSKEL